MFWEMTSSALLMALIPPPLMPRGRRRLRTGRGGQPAAPKMLAIALDRDPETLIGLLQQLGARVVANLRAGQVDHLLFQIDLGGLLALRRQRLVEVGVAARLERTGHPRRDALMGGTGVVQTPAQVTDPGLSP